MATRNADPAWAAMWPAAERRVRRALMRRHVSHEQAADLMQETAMRLVSSGTEVENVDELAAWAYTVASRLAVDQSRRRRIATVPLSEDFVTDADPASIAEARDDWDRVLGAMQTLGPNDRAALLSVFGEQPKTRVEAVRWAVRRHRARIRLVAMVGNLGVAVGVVWNGLRRLAKGRHLAPAAVLPLVLLVTAAVVVLPSAREGADAGATPLRDAGREAGAEAIELAATVASVGAASGDLSQAPSPDSGSGAGRTRTPARYTEVTVPDIVPRTGDDDDGGSRGGTKRLVISGIPFVPDSVEDPLLEIVNHDPLPPPLRVD